MRAVIGIALAWMATVPAATAERPPLPDIGERDEQVLPAIARMAMLEYLRNRSTPEVIAIADGWTGTNADGTPAFAAPAAVTLRHNGEFLARAVRDDGAAGRNVLTAALLAMRSPALPDVVTAEYLKGLTVEVELMGPAKEVPSTAVEQVAAAVEPGLTGLTLAIGVPDPELRGSMFEGLHARTQVMPSTAYAMGWDGGDMVRRCMNQIRVTAANSRLKWTWTVFSAIHTVQYPDARGTVGLYRGKVLLPPGTPAKDELLAAARAIATNLLSAQRKDGQLRLPQGAGGLDEQLLAAWSLARLANRFEAWPEGAAPAEVKALRRGASSVLGYTAGAFVRTEGNAAHVVTIEPGRELAATALFVLAGRSLPTDPEAADALANMRRFLAARISNDGAVTDPQGRPTDPSSAALVALALSDTPEGQPRALGRAVEWALTEAGVLGSRLAAGARNPLPLAWLVRAILATDGGPGGRLRSLVPGMLDRLAEQQVLQGGALDETGAVRDPDGNADTLATGITVAAYAEALTHRTPVLRQGQDANVRRAIGRGWAFCRQMTVHPAEVFFADDWKAWQGTVRRTPRSARVTIPAAAAALEALMIGLGD